MEINKLESWCHRVNFKYWLRLTIYDSEIVGETESSLKLLRSTLKKAMFYPHQYPYWAEINMNALV